VRLLTLTGTGGVGKTRVGLQVMYQLQHNFIHGVCFISLASSRDAELVLPTIAQTLGIQEAGGKSLAELLKRYLRTKHILLLLDNFEQINSATSSVVELLEECPQLQVLVTSRSALHVRGGYEFSVAPLTVPDLLRHPSESEALSCPLETEAFRSACCGVER